MTNNESKETEIETVSLEDLDLFEEQKEDDDNNKEIQLLKKKIGRLEILSSLSIILLLCLLVLNVFNLANQDKPLQGTESVLDTLPTSLNVDTFDEIVANIQETYNANDVEALYNILGDYAQTLVRIEELQEMVDGASLLGKIDKTSYSHINFLEHNKGADWYSLNYVTKYENGNGTLQVTLRVADNQWQVIGFHMNIEQLQNKN